jgi:hypothetical protein
MWTAHAQRLDAETIKVTVTENARPLTRREVIAHWSENSDFRAWFTKAISDTPFDAYFWETPALTKGTLDFPFECVLVHAATLLHVQADAAPFRAHFRTEPTARVLAFPNLGGDARLIVPTPQAAMNCYAHLAVFLRNAPPEQIDAFWQQLGTELRDHPLTHPIWVSTAGLGVSWLHLRLDSRPKYYRHAPYRH